MGDITIELDEFTTDPRVDEYVQDVVRDALGLDEEKKMVVTIDCPYAQYVEFGSDPAEFSVKEKVYDDKCGDWATETKIRIRDWVQYKYNLTDEERKTRGDKIYKDIMEEGMKPKPFVRPAINYMTSDMNAHPDRYLTPESGKSIYEHIANELAGFMARSLIQKGSVISGDLLKSIRVAPASEAEGKELPEDLKKITPEIWRDANLDRHGNWVPPRG